MKKKFNLNIDGEVKQKLSQSMIGMAKFRAVTKYGRRFKPQSMVQATGRY